MASNSTLEKNYFDVLRLVAAMTVVLSHFFLVYEKAEPGLYFGGAQGSMLTLGTMGVTLFFVISGYLITQSAMRQPTLAAYARARCLRIFPAYIVQFFLLLFVLGPLVTDYPLSQYFSWLLHHIAGYGIALAGFALRYLPGCFIHNPFPIEVSSNLWTLQPECMMYALIYLLLYLQKRTLIPFVLISCTVFMFFMASDNIAGRLQGSDARGVLHCFSFLCGSLLWIYKDVIPLRWPAALSCILGAYLLKETPYFLYAYLIATSYVYIYLATSQEVTKYGGIIFTADFSYGIYIYSMPMQQAFIHWFPHDRVAYVCGSLVSTFVLAGLSWYLIEKPALRYKARRAELIRN